MVHFEIETQICKVSLHYFSFFHQRRRRCGKAIGMIIGCGSRWSISSLKFTFFQPHPAQYFSTRWKQNTYAASTVRVTYHIEHTYAALEDNAEMLCWCKSRSRAAASGNVLRPAVSQCVLRKTYPLSNLLRTNIYWLQLIPCTVHWCIPLVCHTSLQHFKRASHVLQTGIIPRRPQRGQNCP